MVFSPKIGKGQLTYLHAGNTFHRCYPLLEGI
jgi:hypothetical protein